MIHLLNFVSITLVSREIVEKGAWTTGCGESFKKVNTRCWSSVKSVVFGWEKRLNLNVPTRVWKLRIVVSQQLAGFQNVFSKGSFWLFASKWDYHTLPSTPDLCFLSATSIPFRLSDFDGLLKSSFASLELSWSSKLGLVTIILLRLRCESLHGVWKSDERCELIEYAKLAPSVWSIPNAGLGL